MFSPKAFWSNKTNSIILFVYSCIINSIFVVVVFGSNAVDMLNEIAAFAFYSSAIP